MSIGPVHTLVQQQQKPLYGVGMMPPAEHFRNRYLATSCPSSHRDYSYPLIWAAFAHRETQTGLDEEGSPLALALVPRAGAWI
jgi:hypothetical protein